MARLRKLLNLPAGDCSLLLKAFLFAWVVRLGLWLLPFSIVRRLLVRFSREAAQGVTEPRPPVDRVVWAVTVASRYVPSATCLTQALVTKLMLGRFGCHVSVRIGVARSEAGEFEAHAWVESKGRVILGGSESSLKRFRPLATSDKELW
jgi:hypothetical protein